MQRLVLVLETAEYIINFTHSPNHSRSLSRSLAHSRTHSANHLASPIQSLTHSLIHLLTYLLRTVKAYTGRSNRFKLGAVEGQVLKNSITSQFVEKPLASVKARLYREEHAIRETIVEHVTEESDDEEKSPEQFTHFGTGDNMFFMFKS